MSMVYLLIYKACIFIYQNENVHVFNIPKYCFITIFINSIIIMNNIIMILFIIVLKYQHSFCFNTIINSFIIMNHNNDTVY